MTLRLREQKDGIKNKLTPCSQCVNFLFFSPFFSLDPRKFLGGGHPSVQGSANKLYNQKDPTGIIIFVPKVPRVHPY